jgi:hypothetical protein
MNKTPTYICLAHGIQFNGIKRPDFEGDFYKAILNSSMEISQQIYKTVKHGCDCPSNYKIFDKIIGVNHIEIQIKSLE